MSARGGEGRERIQFVEVGVGQVFLHIRAFLAARTGGRGLAAFVFTGEEAARQREVGQDADACKLTIRHQLAFDLAFEHVIVRLDRDELLPALHFGEVVAAAQLPRQKIGRADIADLARPHQVIERAHHFVDGDRIVPIVNLIQINMIGL